MMTLVRSVCIKVTPNLRGGTFADFFFCQENESSSVKVSFPEKM